MFDMFLKARNSRKGFTIIELVIVIAIIGILSAVLIPNFSGVIGNANTTAASANLATMNKIAKTSIGDSDISMLKGYAAAVQNFGYDSTKAAVATAVYSSAKHQFVPVADVKVEDNNYDLTNFYPVAATDGKTALESFMDLPFVEKVEGAQALTTGVVGKAINDDEGKYNAVYVVRGSIALYDDLLLGDGIVVFLDGASVELNGKTLGAKAALFLDTTGGTEEVKFYLNGGMLNVMYGYAVASVNGFDLTKNPDFSATNKIEFYQDAIIETVLGGGYVNVANASYHLFGGILLAGAGTFEIDGTSHFVVEDGAYLLTDNGDTETHDFAAVKLATAKGTKLDVSDNSVVSIVFTDKGYNRIISGHSAGSDAWNSINPMTYEICASAVQNTLVLYAQAGADQATVMAICDKFATSVNNTVGTIATAGGATAMSAATTDSISLANTALASSVFGAISAAQAGAATAAVGNAAAGAIASLAGVTTRASLANLAANTASASSTSANATESTTDYSFYANAKEENGVKTYHITTPKQLYSLSWIVCKGLDDFYGTVVSIDNDIDLGDYDNWQPIGNGTFGFRGTMVGKDLGDGEYPTISNMNIDSSSMTVLMSLMGQAWSGTANRAAKEGINYGKQTGDKYAVGFIGVLENGGSVENLNFSKCRVVFNYNWNCSAAIVCGAVVSTGEDYSYNHDGAYITGFDSNGYAEYGTGAPSDQYAAKGPKWTVNGQGEINGAEYTTDINYRAFTGWITSIKNVTTDADCYVECSGRPGGIVGSAGGRYSAGTPNNPYGTGDYNDWLKACAKAEGFVDKYGNGTPSSIDYKSIFCIYGTLDVDKCTNGATVVQNWQAMNYCDAAGILAFFVVKGGSDYSWTIQNCKNTGTISSAFAGGIVGNTPSKGLTLTGNENKGTIVSADTDPSSIKQLAAAIAAHKASTKNNDYGYRHGNISYADTTPIEQKLFKAGVSVE